MGARRGRPVDNTRYVDDLGRTPRRSRDMRKLLLLGVLVLAGCEGFIGPFQSRKPERVDDPQYTISEQERRGRDRLAIPAGDVGPQSGVELPPGYGVNR